MKLRPEFLRRVDALLEQELGIAQAENENVIRELSEQVLILQQEVALWKSRYESEKRKNEDQDKRNGRVHNGKKSRNDGGLEGSIEGLKSGNTDDLKEGLNGENTDDLKEGLNGGNQDVLEVQIDREMERNENNKGIDGMDETDSRENRPITNESNIPSLEFCSEVKGDPSPDGKTKLLSLSPRPKLRSLSPRQPQAFLKMKSMNMSYGMREIPDLRSKSLYDNIVVHSDDEDFHILPTQYSDDEASQDIYRRSPTKTCRPSAENNRNGQDCPALSPVKMPSNPPKISPSTMRSSSESARNSPKKLTNRNSPEKSSNNELASNSAESVRESFNSYESPVKIPRDSPKSLRESPLKAMRVVSDRLSQVEDSEDEVEFRIPDMPRPYTILQRRDFLQKYYHAKIGELKMNLAANPISEHRWIISDFKPNSAYDPRMLARVVAEGTGKRRVGMTWAEESNRKRFHRLAGDDKNSKTRTEDELQKEYDDKLSQIYDKFPSPPGFMMSEFPNTQEQQRRREIVQERQARRVERRIAECLKVRGGQQVGEFVFVNEVVNEYVRQGKWYVR